VVLCDGFFGMPPALNQIYYRFKPFLPWQLRIRLRRIIAWRKRRKYDGIWPINEAAGFAPDGWPGWPDGKKFALVLTHDVEGPEGLVKCRDLMALEQRLGFCSSFNFIPEGSYDVPMEFRADLAAAGFEVGVHDLRHDGKLFWHRKNFSVNARGINHYLKEWGAVGFRAGFMLHDLECLHELEIEYDASTFDTDPFEPQPEGVHTIFPYWVPQPKGGGYVELPYTLPQDSTMFLVLQEKSPEIWQKKLDWIVRRGGMALLNVHPDYMSFDEKTQKSSEFPVAFYQEFLEYIAKNYRDECWQVCPRELARWYRANCVGRIKKLHPGKTINISTPTTLAANNTELPLKGVKVAVVLYSYFATDPRPRREAEALQRAGAAVDVLCLRPNAATPWLQKIGEINVYHMPLKRRRANKLVYMAQYAWFLVCSFAFLTVLNLRRKYKLVHVHNMPDFLVFSALVPKLTGAKVILDLHDPMPELFRSIYGLPADHWVVQWLKESEKRSISFAHLVLTPNIAFRDLFVSRSCPGGKIQTIMNSPDMAIFNAEKFAATARKPGADKLFVLMYHGLLVERHGLDLAIRAIDQLRGRIPGIRLHMYGEPTDYSRSIDELVKELKLKGVIFSHGFKPLSEIARDIADIDLGIIPNRSSSFTQINFPTRIFEYLAINKPVLVPNTKGIQDYFREDEILFFEAGSVEDLAKKIAWAYENPEGLKELLKRGSEIYERLRWDNEEKRLIELVKRLIGRS
jgi:glycosyltransferase involved in cell wall biosynthesis